MRNLRERLDGRTHTDDASSPRPLSMHLHRGLSSLIIPRPATPQDDHPNISIDRAPEGRLGGSRPASVNSYDNRKSHKSANQKGTPSRTLLLTKLAHRRGAGRVALVWFIATTVLVQHPCSTLVARHGRCGIG